MSDDNVAIEDIEQGMRILARIISIYGDDYWPLLERLEAEYNMKLSRKKRLTIYLSQGNSTACSKPVKAIIDYL